MNPRIRALIGKEWSELRHQRTLIWMTVVVPSVLVAIGPLIAVVLPAMAGAQVYEDADLLPAYQALRDHWPQLAPLGNKELFQVLMLRQFTVFLLIIPVMVGISIASYSIVGEKVNRSLEPLLATPITTNELLWAKSLAAAIPAVLLAWLSFAIYVAVIAALTSPSVLFQIVNLTSIGIMLLITPLIAVLGLSSGIITSSRFSDPRTAQQVGSIIILPLVGLMVAQFRGMFFLTPLVVLISAVVLAILDCAVIRVGVNLFQRETILTRWR